MVALSKDDMTSMSLVDDDFDRMTLLVDPNVTLLNSLLNISTQDDIDTQHMKLDNLYLLIKLDCNIKLQIKPQFMSFISRVFTEVRLYETLQNNDINTNLKYFKLLNKSIDLGREVIDLKSTSQFKHISRFFIELMEQMDNKVPTDGKYATLVVELLRYFMFYRNQTNLLDYPLIKTTSQIIINLSDKLNYTINYKYIVTTNISVDNPSKEASVSYSMAGRSYKDTISVPNPCIIENIYEMDILQYCLVLVASTNEPNDSCTELSNDADIRIFILSLLKHSNINLKCAALHFLLYPYFSTSMAWRDTKTVNQLMPFLLKTFDSKCVPWWFDPFHNLITLLELYNQKMPGGNPVVGFLKRTNLIHGFMDLFFEKLKKSNGSKTNQNLLIQFIKFSACCSAFDEIYRLELLKNVFLMDQLKRDIEGHIILLEDFLINKQMFIGMNHDLPALNNSEIVVVWLELLKSFSRSTAALRTTLKKNNLTKNIMTILNLTYSIMKDCYFAGPIFLQTEIKIMGLSLGILCNFIVEFSNVQYFLTDQGIVDICSDILNDPLFNPKRTWRNLTRKMTLDTLNVEEVKTNTLWVIRHLMYNSQNHEKLELLEKISIDTILDFVNDPCWTVQQQCFQVLKNLTCNSRKVINFLLERFKNVRYMVDPADGSRVAVGSTYLFEFLARKLRLLDVHDISQKRTLEAILYIIVNIAAVNENKKELVLEQTDILRLIYQILSETPNNSEKYGNNSELKLACLWILHNILWDSNRHENSRNALYSNAENSSTSTNNSSQTLEGVESTSNYSGLRPNVSMKTVDRCERLQELGFRDLVKTAVLDSNINVRQKATNLDDLMFKLLNGT
ncbi:similar to Saccharomyces cerevisiae YIL017C VID28 Protein involved in proteasome-dependent catabolite degradation of fructose-1,6-bisphosphatase (FBPase) [Maudiozyma barnettii]|uniref:Similar to Saccharomyces cerevisiae YIL017C VID28 Protein involved in proteasome-dependent catabolite degradation of fructose-1,6-bisphosphatase (FBPase) n=1 Tax=Maudiozyma barnettii TaxID=61262 RepID=A0A8H2VHZ0_9SACH|nr:glucose-induced degradation complex subunit VID28 [Kazachstania barnettii]CAB4255750.1 similar to Saccharomyces cerevisiae YIL017C VID28 Protein involved in proteasome-dependent catabolite degradation of fructose-1,6-bisphosphatase (FBPase) [Kazachstania barnettii]CAD1784311.1 similar to Saccharomyces cerevisiae YIL017C VID28 Protein involved in proteasome-dependent catabolite degradation of fructose-1,6-bisphosphatase (FBPase) [Kazachstania barnettii]